MKQKNFLIKKLNKIPEIQYIILHKTLNFKFNES